MAVADHASQVRVSGFHMLKAQNTKGNTKGFLTVFFFTEKQGDTYTLTHLTVKNTDVQYGDSNVQTPKWLIT